MIKLIATAESIEQAKCLIDIGIDEIIIGEEIFGLRLPGYFTIEEMEEINDYALKNDKHVIVAMNAILHNDKIAQAKPFLKMIKNIGIQEIIVGDTGLIQILKDPNYALPYLYDAAVLVTSAGQVNFWAKYGAKRALIANEVPFVELKDISPLAQLPLVYQVYGASCIHQSKRQLLKNYFNYIGKESQEVTDRQLFLSEPNKEDTHYSIYTDSHGTHIFANKDLNLLAYLEDLNRIDVQNWYIDGLFNQGRNFIEIADSFVKARNHILEGTFNPQIIQDLNQTIRVSHPQNRELDTGFFLYEADQVK
ncbi:U32 family peptidase [Facklamia sp. DSM 111018]|uniref:U32 family peptidase n=1 Tax=Facklamia lactis TaxID=2749967 RepID=A0ABS0LQJ9_9LACT|nr:peptidase U32 family protein [Facklamia lactis]MBG9980615.1 U32 family peptidase [Facklamia lactis]MBG9986429.1 U32 family peptidase [Facklamia lactis]